MVSNGIYQRKDDGGVTSGTHNTSHSQISDYNTLGERDYEVIDVGDDKHDYHHLHRPSPPMVPSGRNATFNFTPPKEFHSMSTLTSQLGGKFDSSRGEVLQQHTPPTNGFFPTKCASEGPEDHVYHGLEPSHQASAHAGTARPGRDIYRSPTSSDSPEMFGRGTMPTMDMTTMGYNESLYSPNFESSQTGGRNIGVQQGGLENVPETGSVFSEPMNPTAFPVHNYEKILTNEYETPIITRKKLSASAGGAPPTNTAANSAPSSSLSRSSGSTSKANTGPRYETEVPAQHSAVEEEPQYSKLMRPSVDENSSAVNTISQDYSELSLGTDEEDMAVRTQLDKGLFPNNTSKQRAAGEKRVKAEESDKSFTLPSHMAGGVVPNSKNPIATADISSPTDSLSSYIAHLQDSPGNMALPTDFQMEELLFNSTPQEMDTVNLAAETVQAMEHSNYSQRNHSLESGEAARVPPVSARGPPKRAWSEERGVVGNNGFTTSLAPEREGGMMNSRYGGFSGSAMGGFLLNGQNRHHVAPQTSSALHRDLRPNGLDPRIAEFARSRTMV